MMAVLVLIALGLVAVGGTAVVLTGDPDRQAITLSIYGLLMGLLFLVLQAPDVALSQIAIGTAVVPLLVMLTLRKVRGR